MEDMISRKAAIDAIRKWKRYETTEGLIDRINNLPSAQAETHEKRTKTHSCDCISRQAAIDILDRNHILGQGLLNDTLDHIADAIMALPSAQPENADCIYCHEDSDGYVKPIEKNCHAFIRFGMDGWELGLKANGWHGSAKIRYCPMCGRKLKNDKCGR